MGKRIVCEICCMPYDFEKMINIECLHVLTLGRKTHRLKQLKMVCTDCWLPKKEDINSISKSVS